MEYKVLNIENEFYPNQLRSIKKPPQKLYVLGDEKILSNECLAIVGSRCSTSSGEETARCFARELARKRSDNS